MLGKNVPLTILLTLVIIAGLIGSALGTYETFYNLSKDGVRALIIVLTVEGALILFGYWVLIADDDWTFWLNITLTAVYFLLALAFQIVNGYMHDEDGRLAVTAPALVKWMIRNLVWVPPVVTGFLAFVVKVVDSRRGATRKPILGGSRPNS